MTSTRRAPCPSCGEGRKNDTALANYGDHVHCFRCGYRRYAERPCSSCGEMFEPERAGHDRCEACFRRSGKSDAGVGSRANRKLASDIEAEVNRALTHDMTRLAAISRRTVPLSGTVGEVYLGHRLCALPPPDSDLRFLPGNDRYPPSLCALVTNAVTAEPMTLHFTRLQLDGRGKADERPRTLLKGYPKAGGVIRLWSDESVSHGLAIAEGIETALCAAHAFTPVWSVIDAGNMAKFPVLPGIESLTVFADHDAAGINAARQVARRWRDAGREVRVFRSPIPDQDIADEVAA